MFLAQVLVVPSIKHYKEIVKVENNMVKNQLAGGRPAGYFTRVAKELATRGFRETTPPNMVRLGLEPETRALIHSTTLPPL